MRKVISCLLAALLLLTSQTAAAQRGTAEAAGQMVLCIGSSAVVVYVDAEGQPTTAPHFCPDCALSGDVPRPMALDAVAQDLIPCVATPLVVTYRAVLPTYLFPQNRAPPLSV